jgi:N-acyl homoserine lactone hydrolase
MKRLLAWWSIVLLVLAGLLGWTFTAATLPVPAAAPISLPNPHPPGDMQLFAIPAGRMQSRAMLAFRGGGFSDRRVFGMGAILIRHPRGDLLFDAGFGRDVEAHFRTTPRLMQWTSEYTREATVAEQLQRAGIEPATLKGVVLTHAHWDHVSGLADLPGVPVWVNPDELRFVESDDESTLLARRIGTGNYHVYSFDSGPYLGFARSHDFFGDGSVVLVRAAGHTPGSIIAFIHLANGRRYALIGDLVWQREGIDLPAERPWLPRRLVDSDAEAVRSLIVQMHQLQRSLPGLVVVPAHDRRVWDTLPQLPRS